jgi:hypothetical protein
MEALMAPENPMVQLRKMRDLEQRIRSLTAGRDALICEALRSGYSQGQVAIASGVSQTRVAEIKAEEAGS